jgi:lactate dehydrogenase-like 2-hydroxyacid dehydrogenase
MSATRPLALQMCPFSVPMEAALAERLDLVRWFELAEEDRAALLAGRADAIFAVITGGHVGCPEALMRALPALRLVAINGVGYDKVNLPLARECGVSVTNTPGVLTEDVADLAVGLIIALKRQIPAGDAYVRAGLWPQGDRPLARKVSGSKFGIFGLGQIGLAIADRLAAFGEVAYASRSARPVRYRRFESLRALADWCDILTVACSASTETAGMVDAEILRRLGPQGCLVNVARGSVVDEAALVAALDAGTINGAALDVYAHEPHVPEALCRSSRTVLTPHVASATVETRSAMAALVLANVDALLAGQPPVTPVA